MGLGFILGGLVSEFVFLILEYFLYVEVWEYFFGKFIKFMFFLNIYVEKVSIFYIVFCMRGRKFGLVSVLLFSSYLFFGKLYNYFRYLFFCI